MKKAKTWGSAALFFVVTTVLCGVIYTAVCTGLAQLIFPHQANGSIIEVDGTAYGSELVGQRFTDDTHLWGRAMNPSVGTFTDDEGDDAGELEIPDERFSPEAQLERTSMRESVQRGLDSLSPQYREILVLREINGLSYEEIGRVLGIEEGTVKSRIFRARKKLCDFLLREGNIPEFGASNAPKGGAGV